MTPQLQAGGAVCRYDLDHQDLLEKYILRDVVAWTFICPERHIGCVRGDFWMAKGICHV